MAHVICKGCFTKNILLYVMLMGVGLILLCSHRAMSQRQMGVERPLVAASPLEIGLKGGMNFSFLKTAHANDNDLLLGFVAGGYIRVPIVNNLFFQQELLFSSRGNVAFFEDGPLRGANQLGLHYLDIPVMLSFDFWHVFRVHAGAYGGYLIGFNYGGEGSVVFMRNDFYPIDAGLTGGFEMSFTPLVLGVRYNQGLTQIARTASGIAILGNTVHSFLSVYVALGF
jgi:hypothetical protein